MTLGFRAQSQVRVKLRN